jgi:hypothetical protein
MKQLADTNHVIYRHLPKPLFLAKIYCLIIALLSADQLTVPIPEETFSRPITASNPVSRFSNHSPANLHARAPQPHPNEEMQKHFVARLKFLRFLPLWEGQRKRWERAVRGCREGILYSGRRDLGSLRFRMGQDWD